MAGSAQTFNSNAHNLKEVVAALERIRIQIPLSTFNQTGAPPLSGTDIADITNGWKIGSVWIDTTNANIYKCADNAAGNPKWKKMADFDLVGATQTAGGTGPINLADNEIIRAHGIDGKIQGTSGVTIDDAGVISGITGGVAPTDATYITQTPHATLSAEQAMSALATGLVKNTTTTGVLSIAVAGTDYSAPGHVHAASDITSGIIADARMPDLTGDVTTVEGAVATTLATKFKTYKVHIENQSPTVEVIRLKDIPDAATIVRVTFQVSAGTVDFNIEKRAEATPFTAGTNVFAADQQATTTFQAVTSFASSSIAADDWLAIDVSAVSSPGILLVTVEYTLN